MLLAGAGEVVPAAGLNVLDLAAELANVGPCQPPRATRSGDPAYLVYTSGTTGYPKGVLHAHRAMIGREPAELAGIGGFSPKVQPASAVIIGVRNLDHREKEQVKASRVRIFTMKDVDRLGIATIMERAIAIASKGTAGIHVSFDLDVCDPAVAPGVGTPVKGGLDYREAHMVMEMIADSGRLLSLDMVEVNPILDVRNQTAQLGTELVLSALGQEIL